MLDIAGDDRNWMSHVELPLTRYIGADVVVPLVERNQPESKLLGGSSGRAFLSMTVDVYVSAVLGARLLQLVEAP